MTTILGLIIWAGEVMAIIACFSPAPKKWLRICGGIGACLFMLAFMGLAME